MTCTCAHNEVLDAIEPTKRFKSDPTRTGAIRRAWMTEARTRVRRIERRVRILIESTGGIGLSQAHYRQAIRKDLVGNDTRPWWKSHIIKAYRHGLTRAGKKLKLPTDPPISLTHRNVIDMIVDRTGREFEAVAMELAGQLSLRVPLVDDVDRIGPLLRDRIAKIGATRVNTVIAVEVISTNAEATLHLFSEYKVEKVGVEVEGVAVKKKIGDAEIIDIKRKKPRRGAKGRFAATAAILANFTTAGDADVCPECEALEGKIYDLDNAFGVIPVHPNCRCDWTLAPDNVFEFELPEGEEEV
jgi:hypothetical protein